MSSLDAMQMCRHVAAVAAEHGGDEGADFARRFADYEAGRGSLPLDAALGLRPDAGQQHWSSDEARHRRDELIRDLARHHQAPSQTQTAKMVHRDLARYATGQWRRDCGRGRPADVSGERGELLFKLTNLDARISKRIIDRALAGGEP